jgi:phenylacetate-CoA ligase
MYRWIAGNIFARTLDFARGTRTLACLKELEISQWWTKDQIQRLQNTRLQALIRHAYCNVPYYRQIFDERLLKPGDVQCGADLVKLPILNKHLIRGNFNSLKASNLAKREFLPGATSGSTGNPLKFCSTVDDRYNWGYARAFRARSWSGIMMGDRIADFHPRRLEGVPFENLRKKAKRFFSRAIQIDPNELSVRTLPLIARRLEAFHPQYLVGYPGAIFILARYLHHRGLTGLQPRAILTGDEQLLDYQRELFKKVFQCETYNLYSSWEVFDIAAECAQHLGYHISAENVIVEIVDADGHPAPGGTEGRILLTNLHNYAMPFIRYDIGDSAAISDVACPCGRTGLPLLVNLNGRADDIIITRSGKQIPGRAIPQRFLADFGVEQYQIVQESYDEIIIKIVLDNRYPDDYKAKLIQKIRANIEPVLGAGIAVKVSFTAQIEPAKSGKQSVFISKILSGEK